MSCLSTQEFLEYWFEDALSRGMTEGEAADFAQKQTENYY